MKLKNISIDCKFFKIVSLKCVLHSGQFYDIIRSKWNNIKYNTQIQTQNNKAVNDNKDV